jgi:ABC-type nitrate/sulfonate/bicarbonate transport system substrate-binding protein
LLSLVAVGVYRFGGGEALVTDLHARSEGARTELVARSDVSVWQLASKRVTVRALIGAVDWDEPSASPPIRTATATHHRVEFGKRQAGHTLGMHGRQAWPH